MSDLVNQPPHYTDTEIEPIDVIEDWGLDFHLGNSVKYIKRFRKKDGIRDLRKALWYLQRRIELELQVIKPKAEPLSKALQPVPEDEQG